MSLITKTKTFNPEDVTLSDVKTNQFGGKMVFLNINKHPIYLVTPKMRMPFKNIRNKSESFQYNIAEYLFYLNSNKKFKLKKKKNTIKTINTHDFKDNYWEFTRKKIIWARKSDKIKNEIDFDQKALNKSKKLLKSKKKIKDYKINMFDKLNKFSKYDSLDIKNNRRI